MDSFVTDFLYAFRVFFKRPGLTVLSITALALSLGLSITTFSQINELFFKPLPFEDADELHDISLINTGAEYKRMPIPLENYPDLRNLDCFSETMGYFPGTINISGKGLPERYDGNFVTNDFPVALGVEPLMGRPFSEHPFGGDEVGELMISYSAWQEQFLSDPDIIGTVVRANGLAHEIVAVLPEGFHFRIGVDVWMPVNTNPAADSRQHITQIYALGRIADGYTLNDVQKALGTSFKNWSHVTLEDKEGTRLTCSPFGKIELSKANNYAFIALLGALIFVLLVSCANVANLLVGRALTRGREMAIRSAVGASRSRIIRQLLTESLLLALFGTIGGLLISAWNVDLFADLDVLKLPYWMTFELDWRVFLFAFLIMIGTTLISGLIPAWQSSKIDLNEMLKDTTHTSTSFKLGRLTRMLAVVQIAFSCSLLFGAGLITRNVYKMANVDPGYNSSDYLTMRMGLFPADYPTEASRDAFFRELEHKISQLPEIEEAAVSSWIAEFGNKEEPFLIINESDQKPQFEQAFSESVSENFFTVYDLQPVIGTLFDQESVAEREDVPVVVNQAFANDCLPGINPIGQQLGQLMGMETDGGQQVRPLTIVGVVPDIRVTEFAKPGKPEAIVYMPFTAAESSFMTLVAKSPDMDKDELKTTIQRVILTLDPNLPVYFTKTMEEFIEERIFPFRSMANFFLFVGLMALFLAAIGVYGMLAFNVSRRRREIGIRMALGAGTMGIVGQVLRQGVFQLALGLLIGTCLAFVVGKLTSKFLLGINPTDPSVYIGVLLTLFGVATLSFFIPARRAASLSPLEALRYE